MGDIAAVTKEDQERRAMSHGLQQLYRGEITVDDFNWLFGTPKDFVFLIPNKQKRKVHLFANGDTFCKAISSGFIRAGTYRIESHDRGREVCANCRMLAD